MESLPFLVPVLCTVVCVPILTFACCLGGLRKRVAALEERAELMDQERSHSPFSGGVPAAAAAAPHYVLSPTPPSFIGGVQYPQPTAPLPFPLPRGLPLFPGLPQQGQQQHQQQQRRVV